MKQISFGRGKRATKQKNHGRNLRTAGLSKPHKKDIFGISAVKVELSQKICLFYLSESVAENPGIKHFFRWFFIIIF